MNGKGRIVIPKGNREKLGLASGSKLVIEPEGKRIILSGLELKEADEAQGVKKKRYCENGQTLRQFLFV